VAFRVPDILQAARQATAAGVEFLPIQAPHHDSAPARLGYTPPDLGELRSWNVAVELDGDGRATRHATTGLVGPRSLVTLGLVQRQPGPPRTGQEAVIVLAAARAAIATADAASSGP
jgi:hypothetical protein